ISWTRCESGQRRSTLYERVGGQSKPVAATRALARPAGLSDLKAQSLPALWARPVVVLRPAARNLRPHIAAGHAGAQHTGRRPRHCANHAHGISPFAVWTNFATDNRRSRRERIPFSAMGREYHSDCEKPVNEKSIRDRSARTADRSENSTRRSTVVRVRP